MTRPAVWRCHAAAFAGRRRTGDADRRARRRSRAPRPANPVAAPSSQLHIDRVTPTSSAPPASPVVTVTGTVTNVGDRPVRDVMVRLEHAAAVTTSAGLRTRPRRLGRAVREPSPTSSPWRPNWPRASTRPFTLTYPVRSADRPSLRHREARHLPGARQRQRDPRLRRPRPARRRPLPAARARRAPRPAQSTDATRLSGRRAARHLTAVADDHAVAARRQTAAGGGRARRHHAGAADRRRPRDVAGRWRPTRHAARRRRLRHQPARRSRRPGAQRRRASPSTPTCSSPSTR